MSAVKTLYGGEVLLRFSEGTHRYDVSTDGGKVWEIKKGVTTILGATLNKPALMLWPLNEAMKSLGAKMVCTDQETQKWEWVLEREVIVNTIKIQAAATAHRKRSDKGKDVGHEAHALVEQYLKAVLDPSFVIETDGNSPEALKAYQAFVRWYTAQKSIKVLGIEQIVFSRKYDVAGTFDCLLEIDGKKVLCDLKTTNISRDAPLGVYPEMFLQLGAYAQAYLEETGAADRVINEYLGTGKITSLEGTVQDVAIINAGKTGNLSVVYASELGLSVEDCIKGWLRVLGTFRFLQPLAKQLKEKKE